MVHGWTDRVIPIYPPPNFVCGGGGLIIFLTSIKSIISTVKAKKNRQICRFLTKKQICIRSYDMVLLRLIVILT